MIASVLLIIAVGWGAYVLTREPPSRGPDNLIALSVAEDDIEPVIVSSRPVDIEEYIREAFGVDVVLPDIQGAEIYAAGALAVRRGISIPTVLFEDPDGDLRRMFVFTYSLLDDWSLGVYLDRSVRLELEHDGSRVVMAADDEREVILWRSRDDIFLAVAEHGASRLIRRIRPT
jgi:hypothetical protein